MSQHRLQQLFCLLVFGAMAANTAWASTDSLRVVGLFKDTAIVHVGDRTHTLHVGQTGPAGIRLESANAEHAVFTVNGNRVERGLSDNSVIQLAPAPRFPEARLQASNGVYQMPGAINGQLVSFILDTGASYISLNTDDARHLGIDYEQGESTMMNTANGQTPAHLVELDKVSVGEIEMDNVTAAVLEKIPPGHVLLGMSFLQKVELHNQGQVMLLRQRSQ
jgi:aspartyl protease family protein